MPEELSPESKMLAEAQAALELGEKGHARDLLTRLIKTNKNNPQVWLLMSAAVETNKERIFCLNEALSIDPQNQLARRGLVALGALPYEEGLGVPLAVQKRNWEAALFGGEASETRAASRAFLQLGGVVAVVILFIVAVIILIASGRRPAAPPPVTLIRTATYGPTVTYEATASPVVRSPTPTFIGPTPLWMLLAATYTPTPLVVNTPHSRTESYRSAISAYKRGDWSMAMTYLQQVTTVEPSAPDIYYLMGEVSRFQKKYSDALNYYQDALDKNANFAPAYLGQGRTILEYNPTHPELAVSVLEKAVSLDPRYFEAYLELANARIATEDGEGAQTALETAAALGPTSPLLYYYRAEAELITGDDKLALADAQLALDNDSTYLPSYRLLGEAYRANDLVGDAQTPLEMYTRYVTDDEEAYLWLGEAYLDEGSQDKARRAFDQAIKLDPTYFDARMQRGLLLLSLNDGDNAAEDFRVALQANTSSFDASLDWGRALLVSGNYQGAVNQFNNALRLARTNQDKAAVYYYRALAQDELGSVTLAIQAWEYLLDLPPQGIDLAWLDQAQQRLQSLYTPTPTLVSTLTPAATKTPTPRPSATLIATPTLIALPTLITTPTFTSTPKK